MAQCSVWCLVAVLSALTLKGFSQDFDLWDALDTPTKPTPPKPITAGRGDNAKGELDLSDALDPDNDIRKKDKEKGLFSDDDLLDVANSDYKPDKGKGGAAGGGGAAVDTADDVNYDTEMDPGSIAGIASAVAMALVGAVSSYVSYQKKKFCFSVQQNLNAQYTKAEGPESVISQEPPVQQAFLEPPSAMPPNRL